MVFTTYAFLSAIHIARYIGYDNVAPFFIFVRGVGVYIVHGGCFAERIRFARQTITRAHEWIIVLSTIRWIFTSAGSYLSTRELVQWILYSNIREYLSFASHWVHHYEYEQGLHRLHYGPV